MWETQVRSQGREDPLEKENGNPLQYSCLENPMEQQGIVKACCLPSYWYQKSPSIFKVGSVFIHFLLKNTH